MSHCPLHQPGVLLFAVVARFMLYAGDVRGRMYVVTALLVRAQLSLRPVHACLELALIVEGRDDHVASLVAHRVVAVVVNDEPSDAVVVRINPAHDSRIGPSRQRSVKDDRLRGTR